MEGRQLNLSNKSDINIKTTALEEAVKLKRIDNDPLYIKAEKEILKLIWDDSFADNRLQPEEELAKMLGVSRYTIREALNSLWKKGYLTKRHGKGNFLHKSALSAKMRIDVFHNFFDLIGTAGYIPRIDKSDFERIIPTDNIKEKFGLDDQERVIKFTWLYYADQIPAIIVDIQIPEIYFQKKPEQNEEESLREFLEKYCHQDLAQCIANINAINNEDIARRFQVEAQTAFIMWEELFYNIYDQMICYNEIYFNPQVMNLSLLIKI